MERKKQLFLIIALLLFLVGCSQPQTQQSPEEKTSETVKLFFADANNETFATEERQISFSNPEQKYQITLEQLVKGPEDRSLNANIPEDTVIYGTITQNKALIVDLSREFSNFGGSVAEIIAVGSIVNTMAQFDEIKEVKILVEGKELIGPSGQARGFMKPFNQVADEPEQKEVVLYFGNANATKVKGEKRVVEIPPGTSQEEFVQILLEEMINGPQTPDLNRTIPEEVKVTSVTVTDGTAHVDFSREMHTKHWGGATGEAMTISSIVSTLTELDYIHEVKMTVEGQPIAIEHTILTEPLPRNESMIEK